MFVGILASSHPLNVRFMCFCEYAHILRSMRSRYISIIASSSSLVLGSYASQFVNNSQILRIGQAFVLEFC